MALGLSVSRGHYHEFLLVYGPYLALLTNKLISLRVTASTSGTTSITTTAIAGTITFGEYNIHVTEEINIYFNS